MSDFDTSLLVGRWRDLAPDRNEVRALQSGFDFREPQYRREVFLRFYEFHLRYRTHPGCVYLLFPELLRDKPVEDWFWFAQINGLTQNPVTSMIIFQHFPEVPREERPLRELEEWFNANWDRLAFDTDRRYQKKDFPAAIRAYSRAMYGMTQEAWFLEKMEPGRSDTERFDLLWKAVDQHFYSFGRLSTWSYLEYLFICGFGLEPSSMMLKDMSGSKSHRNGLAIVLGRDDLDWRKDTAFQGKYLPEVLTWMEVECDRLIEEMKERTVIRGQDLLPWARHISRFTLESALCTYKGWHRPNRRYPNVYMDMLYDRIRRGEKDWPAFDFSPFWEARKTLPEHLRLEDNPDDPGLQRIKQNHYRLTGQVIMMDKDWSVFRNDNSWRIGR